MQSKTCAALLTGVATFAVAASNRAQKYSRLCAADRRALVEIPRDTKKNLPESLRGVG